MTDTSMSIGVSFARTPLEEITAKVEQIKALGWEERENGRGDPWMASFRNEIPEDEVDAGIGEVEAVMGDDWLDTDAIRALKASRQA